MSALALEMQPLVYEYAIPGGVVVEVPNPPGEFDVLGRSTRTHAEVRYDPIAIHPATPKELSRLPEADRVRGVIVAYALDTSPANALPGGSSNFGAGAFGLIALGGSASPAAQPSGDLRYVIQWSQVRWEVFQLSDYRVQGGVIQAMARRVEEYAA